jgi:hypothetical protein
MVVLVIKCRRKCNGSGEPAYCYVKGGEGSEMRINIGGRLAKGALVATMLVGLSACGGVNKPFNPMDSGTKFKQTSLAVIAGGTSDGDIKLAEEVTNGLTKRSTYHVLSQEEIAQRIPDYPVPIAYKEQNQVGEKDDKVVWFLPSEKKKLNAIQARLKVDNLFVIWNSEIMLISSSQGGSTYYVYPVGNMIEYPGAKVVASTRSANGSSTSILALFHSKDYYIVDALNGAAGDIVDDFLDATKSQKR